MTLVTAFGHPLGPQQRLTSMFVPYHRIWSPIPSNLAFVSDFASFGAAEGRSGADHAPRAKAMARVTFATAFGHPLGPQQRLTSAFVPYCRAVPPLLFDLVFVSFTLLALPLLRGGYIFPAPKG